MIVNQRKDEVPVTRHPLTILIVGCDRIRRYLFSNLSHIISGTGMNDVARRTKAAESDQGIEPGPTARFTLIATAFENFQQDVSAYPLKEDEFRN
jgi:hypothetical protein